MDGGAFSIPRFAGEESDPELPKVARGSKMVLCATWVLAKKVKDSIGD